MTTTQSDTSWTKTSTDWTYDSYTNPLFPGIEIRKSALNETYRVTGAEGTYGSLAEAAGIAKHLS